MICFFHSYDFSLKNIIWPSFWRMCNTWHFVMYQFTKTVLHNIICSYRTVYYIDCLLICVVVVCVCLWNKLFCAQKWTILKVCTCYLLFSLDVKPFPRWSTVLKLQAIFIKNISWEVSFFLSFSLILFTLKLHINGALFIFRVFFF